MPGEITFEELQALAATAPPLALKVIKADAMLADKQFWWEHAAGTHKSNSPAQWHIMATQYNLRWRTYLKDLDNTLAAYEAKLQKNPNTPFPKIKNFSAWLNEYLAGFKKKHGGLLGDVADSLDSLAQSKFGSFLPGVQIVADIVDNPVHGLLKAAAVAAAIVVPGVGTAAGAIISKSADIVAGPGTTGHAVTVSGDAGALGAGLRESLGIGGGSNANSAASADGTATELHSGTSAALVLGLLALVILLK